MKKKLAVLLTIALSVAMLGGCGGGSSKTGSSTSKSSTSKSSTSKSSTNSSTVFGSSKTKTLSEYLSEEDTIYYTVSSVDKDKTPKNIYFFKDGTLTVLPGDAFGLTMGDFAQMTDKEIWEIYEDVRESYAEEYVAEKLAELQQELERWNGYLEDWSSVMSEFQEEKEEILNEINEGSINEDDAVYELMYNRGFYYYMYGYVEAESWPTEIEEVETILTESVDKLLTVEESIIAELERLNTESACAGPFYDQTVYFAITTDSSGNNVQDEQIVWATHDYTMLDFMDNICGEIIYDYELSSNGGHYPATYYTGITFANVEGADREIYDSTYNCFGLRSSDYTFCTRDSMTLDTVDSKNVLIDQSEEDLNLLFEAEVMARYE